MNYFALAFKKYAVFNGRSNRSEYWAFFILQTIPFILGYILIALLASNSNDVDVQIGIIGILLLLWGAITLMPALALNVRRLHDIGASGWCILLYFVPLLGGLFAFVVSIKKGQPFANKYGNPPNFDGDIPKKSCPQSNSKSLLVAAESVASFKKENSKDPTQSLIKLKDLLDSGLIDNEDYERKKKEILDKI